MAGCSKGSIIFGYIGILTLAEFITGWCFAFYNFDTFLPSINEILVGPLFYVAIAWCNFWLLYRVFKGQLNRKKDVFVAIIYRLWTLLGKYLIFFNIAGRFFAENSRLKAMFSISHTSHIGDLARINLPPKNNNTIDLDYPCALQNTLVFGL